MQHRLIARRGGLTRSTVTDIATRFGFFELGRFPVRYRQRFDEKPSETLARCLEWTHLKRTMQTTKGMTVSNSIDVA
jgi:hypothetical protein